MKSLLELRGITVHYGKALALDDISIDVGEGEIVTIIGSNGAGKSTTLKAIAGLVHLTTGEIFFEGNQIDREPPEMMVRSGISYCMEGRRLFPNMTVLENLEMGAIARKDRDGIKADLKSMFERFPILEERRSQKAGTLSGGQQQMLTIGRALMSKPRLLLMDEPSLGLAPMVVADVARIVKELNKTGLSVLLVEQNAQMALALASRGYVLEVGSVIAEGDAEPLRDNAYVRRAYLGVCE
jgi:branched-chain amino acid transport system ATP-binding protein